MKNKFIVIEGIDCSGKTTLVEELRKNLIQSGYNPIVLEEFGTIVGRFFFETVVENNLNVQIPAQVLIRAAGQISELLEKIEQSKSPNTIFLADRYIDSNVVYQSIEFTNNAKINSVSKKYFQEWARKVYGPFYIKPSIIIILDLPVTSALKRANHNNEQIKPKNFLISARKEFLQLANKSPHLYKTIDATKLPSEVLFNTMKLLRSKLSIKFQ